MKIIYLFLLCIFFAYGQQQVKIPWPSLADSPWPVLRGDMQGTGRSEYVGPSTNSVIWRKDMPFGVVLGPIIGYDNNLFVGTNSYNSISVENYFYSLTKDGNNIWTFITEDDRRANVAGPTLSSDSTIYFASIGGGLYALTLEGNLKWNNSKFQATYFTRHISVDKNSNIYDTWIDTLFVIDSKNGLVIDSFYTPKIAGTEVVFSTGGDTIFYWSGRLHTEDPKFLNAISLSGVHLWSTEFFVGSHSYGPLAVDNENHIYLYASDSPFDQYLYCINPDGTVNWKYELNSNEGYENYSAPTIAKNGNIIFQTSSGDSGYINSVDYYGNLNWKTTLGHYFEDGARINHGLVSDAEGKIYCGSTYGITTNFWCLSSEGTILWKLDLEGYEYDSSPAISSDGTLYIGTHLSSLFNYHVRNLIAVRDTVTSVEYEGSIPVLFNLEQNYPNPFNSTTNIRYAIPQSGRITVKVYDLMGREVATLVDRYQEAGSYDVIFQVDDMASGIYFYQLQAGDFIATKKLILLK
jgi:outer membrane protein assembly factor BamB